MTDANYQSFFGMTVESFVRPWEKYVMGMRFSEVCSPPYFDSFTHPSSHQLEPQWRPVDLNLADIQLGAIRYERDVRSIANYLSTQTTFGGARDKFTRLQQISTVLNLDAVSRRPSSRFFLYLPLSPSSPRSHRTSDPLNRMTLN